MVFSYDIFEKNLKDIRPSPDAAIYEQILSDCVSCAGIPALLPMLIHTDTPRPSRSLGIDWGKKRVLTFSNGYCISPDEVNGFDIKTLGDTVFDFIVNPDPYIVTYEGNVPLFGSPALSTPVIDVKHGVYHSKTVLAYTLKRILTETDIVVASVSIDFASTRTCCKCLRYKRNVGNNFHCPDCEVSFDRDFNAAVNLAEAVCIKNGYSHSMLSEIRCGNKHTYLGR